MTGENHDELPPLPPIDDDGGTVDDGSAIEGMIADEGPLGADALETSEIALDSLIDALAVDGMESLLDDARVEDGPEAPADIAFDEERDLLAGSDEGDGRDISAAEAGIFVDDGAGEDDGGSEGTGEDPSLALEETAAVSMLFEADQEGVDEQIANAAAAEESWPRRADVSWKLERVDDGERTSMPSIEPPEARGDGLRARVKGGVVSISFDDGASFAPLAGCAGATAIAAIPGAPGGRAFVVALYDAGRDASAIAVVRVAAGQAFAELVADLVTQGSARDDEEEVARVEAISIEVVGDRIDVLLSGRFGAQRASTR